MSSRQILISSLWSFYDVGGTYSPLQILNLLSDKISADGFGSVAANS